MFLLEKSYFLSPQASITEYLSLAQKMNFVKCLGKYRAKSRENLRKNTQNYEAEPRSDCFPEVKPPRDLTY